MRKLIYFPRENSVFTYASHINTAAAIAALRDSLPGSIGILIIFSEMDKSSLLRPCPSLPTAKAKSGGSVTSLSKTDSLLRAEAYMGSLNLLSSPVLTRQICVLKQAPIDALTVLGL